MKSKEPMQTVGLVSPKTAVCFKYTLQYEIRTPNRNNRETILAMDTSLIQ